MVRHICMFTLKEEDKEKNIAEFCERAEKLRAIEEVKGYNVVRNVAGTPDSNYDVALIFDFDTVEDLDKYQKADLHLEFGAFVSTVRTSRACIDFEI
ncbi:MAG: Dabb family protein [Roseburia sp.]|nr:Dabb family protein [Roseburia sp.]